MTSNCSDRIEVLVLGQAAIMKKIKSCEGMTVKHFNHQAMTTMVTNGKLKYLMQSRKNVPDKFFVLNSNLRLLPPL